MSKSAFRPRPYPRPDYPILEQFDRERRSFLQRLGAAVLGSALLAPFGAEAGQGPGKKKGDKKKKKKDDAKEKPHPPLPGKPVPPPARKDELVDDAWASVDEAGQPPPKDDKKKKDAKDKNGKKDQPPPRPSGEAPEPNARLDDLED